jgi:phosphoribosylaminoimidazolecarboxamide formyltransferase/IMP cyclohydrolase
MAVSIPAPPEVDLRPIRRALLSVHDKTGLVEFARALASRGVQLLSTGGTWRTLHEAGLAVTEVADVTGFPEMLDGRVKTLHPKVHGGILFRRGHEPDEASIREHGIGPIDLVVVSLYPFEKTAANPAASADQVIEMIDIGGPSMIRSAAKNHRDVTVISDRADYGRILVELDEQRGCTCLATRRELALAAFERTSRYDLAISSWLRRRREDQAALHLGENAAATAAAEAALDESRFPPTLTVTWTLKTRLRYGENPHQAAAFYVEPDHPTASLGRAVQISGKELSYNNILDLDSALAMVRAFREPAAVLIKHNNPCGAAIAPTLRDAYDRAHEADTVSAFGSVVGLNRIVDAATATRMTDPNQFIEAIIAPDFDDEALAILTTRPAWRQNVRLLRVGDMHWNEIERARTPLTRPIEGGMLRQMPDLGIDGFEGARLVTRRAPDGDQLRDLRFAWEMVKHVRSNAILLARQGATVGIGAGQMSRIDAAEISFRKAGERAVGAVLASDAFFPFRDTVDRAAMFGIRAIVQPGGSKRDQDSIDACDEHDIAMLFTAVRHFRH